MERGCFYKFVERAFFEKNTSANSAHYLSSLSVIFLEKFRRCDQTDDFVVILFDCVLSKNLPKYRKDKAIFHFLNKIQGTYGFFDIESLEFFLKNHKGSIKFSKEDCGFVWGDSSLWKQWILLRRFVSALSGSNIRNISGLRCLGKGRMRLGRNRSRLVFDYFEVAVA